MDTEGPELTSSWPPSPWPPAPDKSGSELVLEVEGYVAERREFLVKAFNPCSRLFAEYKSVLVDIVSLLGLTAPSSEQDRVCRDLIADAYDFMCEWERVVTENKPNVAYPLARRAYETVSLLSVCMQNERFAVKWSSGRKIDNGEVRQALARLPASEDQRGLTDLNTFFSEGAHVNRSLVAQRYLGEGNLFVLGAIAPPDLLHIAIHCKHLCEMWFWFGACSMTCAKELVHWYDKELGRRYFHVAGHVDDVLPWLSSEIDRLQEADEPRDT